MLKLLKNSGKTYRAAFTKACNKVELIALEGVEISELEAELNVLKVIKDAHNFQYLLQFTVEGSRAREVIESFPPTDDNYPKAIDCLKTRFGRNDLQVEVYVSELLKLVMKNPDSNFCSNNFRALYDNLEQQIRALQTLGVTTDESATFSLSIG
ncbi:hypothetical protein AVEN_58839-1 [Araneus ventricosus]|uniref:Uncharacterized protein n=1 Tax=Araneus ventricosus TaxID=182803 RepID=A0A4Y2SS78_ARAVE|nr:hypothetical protein AVEN_58839-1 [Araneus ventricosus]